MRSKMAGKNTWLTHDLLYISRYQTPIANALQDYWKHCRSKTRQELTMYREVGKMGQILVDVQSGKLHFIRNSWGNIELGLPDNLKMTDYLGNSATIEIEHQPDEKGIYDWKVKEYNLSLFFKQSSLRPALAWEVDERDRRWPLAQKQFQEVFNMPQLMDTRPDRRLGLVLAGLCSPEVVQKWDNYIQLDPRGPAQTMYPLQRALQAGLSKQSWQLFHARNGLLQKVEERLTS